MSYEIGGRVVRVRLRNTEFDGAEARAEATTVEEYLAIRGQGDKALWEAFVDHLLDWTLTYKDEPVPATPEGALMVDSSLGLSLAIGWLNGITRVVEDIPMSKRALETLGLADDPAAVGNGAVDMEVL